MSLSRRARRIAVLLVCLTGSVQAAAPAADADPLEHLRRRLAEKLGAERKADAPAAGKAAAPVVRIVNRNDPGPAPAPAAAERARAGRSRAAQGTLSPAAAGRVSESPRLAVQRSAAGAAPGHAVADPSHAGASPAPEHATCSSGRRQSPIDIQGGLAVDLAPVRFDYRPGAAGVIDTGHTVQVEVAPGSAIELSGRRYELVDFHFHRPSEEAIDGRRSEMGVHLLHRDAQGQHAMVAVLLERGSAQPLIQAVWNDLPLEQHRLQPMRDAIDPSVLLPAARDYHTYMGSLSTPPCTEGVLWIVLKTPLTLSDEQLALFARLYPMNARPLQPAHGRLIKQSR